MYTRKYVERQEDVFRILSTNHSKFSFWNISNVRKKRYRVLNFIQTKKQKQLDVCSERQMVTSNRIDNWVKNYTSKQCLS